MLAAIFSRVNNLSSSQNRFQQFTSSGTFTAPITGWYDVQLNGAGGGSGGATSSNGFIAASSGGGAGQELTLRIFLTAGQTVSVVVGTGGTAGAATPTNGGNGGASSITVSGTTFTARGGFGSAAAYAVASFHVFGAIGQGGQTVPDTTASRNAQIFVGGVIEGANGGAANSSVAGGACGSFTGGNSFVNGAGGGAASSLGAGGNGANTPGTGQAAQGLGAGAGGSLRASVGAAAGAVGGNGRVVFSWVAQ